MDTITEIKEGVQGMNLDPITALLFEQGWLQTQECKLSGRGLRFEQEWEKVKRRLEEIRWQIEELGNKTFKL